MGWKAGTTAEASFGMRFIVAEITIQQYMAHGPSLIAVMKSMGLFGGIIQVHLPILFKQGIRLDDGQTS